MNFHGKNNIKNIVKINFIFVHYIFFVKLQGMAQTIDGRPCVVDALCTMHDGIIKEVKAIREHWWRRRIRELFENR